MFILKLALITCAVYIGITLLIVLGGFVIVYLKGMVAHSFNFRAWTIQFGLVWFVSFVIVWRIIIQHALKAFKSCVGSPDVASTSACFGRAAQRYEAFFNEIDPRSVRSVMRAPPWFMVPVMCAPSLPTLPLTSLSSAPFSFVVTGKSQWKLARLPPT